MTAPQAIKMMQMLLDDGRFWFSHQAEVVNSINEAQLMVLKKYISLQDEYILRESYRYAETVYNGDTVVASVSGEYLFYPKAVRVRTGTETQQEDAQLASYLSPDLYDNFIRTNSWYPGGRYPRSLYYTIKSEYNSVSGLYEPKLYFNSPDATANAFIWFICIPRRFYWEVSGVNVSQNEINDIPLETSDKIHTEICLVAAEILNDRDVEEVQREGRIEAGAYVPYDKVSLL